MLEQLKRLLSTEGGEFLICAFLALSEDGLDALLWALDVLKVFVLLA